MFRSFLILFALVALPAAAQNVANGQNLYNNICRACHGFPPNGGPETAAGAPDTIRHALETVAPMSFIQLTNPQIADIAAYLLSLTEPVPGNPVPALNYTGLWFDPAQSGWGVKVMQHPSNKIFSLFYLYEPPNRTLWISMPDGAWTTTTAYTGKIYRVSGPTPTGAFDSTKIGVREVGTATFTFTSQTAGTLSYTIDGTTVTKAITRFDF